MSNPRDGDDIEYNDNEENELALSEEEEEEDNKMANMEEEEDKEEEEERLIKKAKAKAAKEDRDEEEEDDSMGWQDDDMDDDDDEDEMMYGDTAEGDEEDEDASQASSSSSTHRDEEEDDDDDHPHGERYLQKLDERVKKDYMQEIHPEAFLHNYEEVMSLSQITRDENYRIIDPLHKTLPFLTKYERTRLLGMRAKQINAGATPLVEVPETMLDGQLIAERELQERKLPFVLRRPLPNGTFEYWRVSDLELL
jgi:DNA-directed RNA polymerase I, II, and III subunit RPABC2